jgi:hypothetical protein
MVPAQKVLNFFVHPLPTSRKVFIQAQDNKNCIITSLSAIAQSQLFSVSYKGNSGSIPFSLHERVEMVGLITQILLVSLCPNFLDSVQTFFLLF